MNRIVYTVLCLGIIFLSCSTYFNEGQIDLDNPPKFDTFEEKEKNSYTIYAGDTLLFPVFATDADSSDSVYLDFIGVPSKPSSIQFHQQERGLAYFFWPSGYYDFGKYTFLFIATDTILSDTTVINIEVKEPFRIDASSEPVGHILPLGTVYIRPFDDTTFALIPPDSSQVAYLTIDDKKEVLYPKLFYRFENVQRNHKIKVRYVKKKYNLIVSSAKGGKTDPSGAVEVTHGESQSIKATADNGYKFTHWSIIEGEEFVTIEDSTKENTTVTLKYGSGEVKANFTQHVFTVDLKVQGNGDTDPKPKKYTKNKGERFTVKATPKKDYHFERWLSDQLSSSDKKKNELDFEVHEDYDLTAIFTKNDSHTVIVDYSGGGSTIPLPAKYRRKDGSTFSVTAFPDVGYEVYQWVKNEDTLNNSNNTYSFTVSGSTTIKPLFKKKKYTVTTRAFPLSAGKTSPDSQVVSHGDKITIKVTYNSPYYLKNWSNKPHLTQTEFDTVVTSDIDLTAYLLKKYLLEVEPSTGGTTDITSQYFRQGETARVLATASSGWIFTTWSGDYTGTNALAQVTMNSDKTIKPLFVKAYNLSTTVTGQGSVNPDQGTYPEGATVSLTPRASSGWRFSHWSGDATGSAAPLTVTMDSDKNIEAVFVKSLTLTVEKEGNGTVTPEGGSFDENEEVTLNAVASTGWRFDRWSGDITSTNDTEKITMNTDKTVRAHFIETHTVNTTTEGIGSVNIISQTFDSGEEVTLIATADAGWVFDHWEGDITTTNDTVTFTIKSNVTAKAVFKKLYTLTVTTEGNGTTNIQSGTYPDGTEVTIIATPDAGWNFHKWSGAANSGETTITITMNSDKSLIAKFKE